MTVAVVTGSSTGIGYSTAIRLAKDGHHVVATMRKPDGSDLGSQGPDIEVKALDVNDDASVGTLFSSVGPVDVLVNNAGVAGSGGVVEELGLDSFREVMETNYFGALRCIKAVLPAMRERGSGCIVNVSSMAGRLASPSMSPYCSSKWALEALSEALAVEVAPFGIRIAVVEPGMILTPIWSKVDMTPPTGPYAPVRNKLGGYILKEMVEGSTSDEVADCIAEAINTDSPKLRWLVGQGAERNIRNRRGMTDEEWADLWHAPDEEFFERVFTD